MKICSVEDCGRKHVAKGLCGTHYARAKKGLDPDAPVVRQHKRGVPCRIEGCDRLSSGRGLCSMHYMRDREGRPMGARVQKLRGASLSERLEFYSLPPDGRGCRLWTGHIDKCGYPVVSMGASGRSAQAHRMAYQLATGETLLGNEVVHHKCTVRHCIEPTHLQKVTGTENTAEMLERNWYLRRIAELEAQMAACTCVACPHDRHV